MNIFFVGPRGSGKSTLASRLSAELKNQYLDTDELIVQKTGESISEIVGKRGWEGFRGLEHQVLKDVCRKDNCSVATGGGIVLLDENRWLLKQSGTVFYLITDIEVLYNRLKDSVSDESRPSLNNLPLKKELVQTIRERENLYLETTDYILAAEKNPSKLVQECIENLRL